jgi:hypothetical protein
MYQNLFINYTKKYMLIKWFLILSFLSLLLSGCNMTTDHCSSTEVKYKLYQQLTEQALKLTTQKRNDYYDGTHTFGATKVRDSLALIHITFDNLKLIKQDPNNHLSMCTGELNASIPPPMLTGANSTLETQHQINVTDYAATLHIENTINVFTQDVSFSVIPSGKGKSPEINFDSSAWALLLDNITTAILLKPSLHQQEKNPVRPSQQAIQKIETLKPSFEINTATQENQVITHVQKTLQKKETIQQALQKNSVSEQNNSPIANISLTSPGFDCSKATKPTDITICGNAKLAALDVENMGLYKNAKTINPANARDIWKASIKSKYLCKTDIVCISNVYKKSIQRYQCVAVKKKYAKDIR